MLAIPLQKFGELMLQLGWKVELVGFTLGIVKQHGKTWSSLSFCVTVPNVEATH